MDIRDGYPWGSAANLLRFVMAFLNVDKSYLIIFIGCSLSRVETNVRHFPKDTHLYMSIKSKISIALLYWAPIPV